MVVKSYLAIIIMFFFISCKDSEKNKIKKLHKINQDSLLIYKKRRDNSLLLLIKNKEQYPKTTAKNKKFLEALIFEKIKYNRENDFNNIKSVLLETPSEVDYTYLHNKINKNGIAFQNFGIANFLEYKKSNKEYCPFIKQKTKQIDFIISYDENAKIPLKISFKKGQYFWFGKNFKWITTKIKINDSSIDYQHYNKNSFQEDRYQNIIRSGSFFEFNKKKFLLFTNWDGMWCIHHLFDITNESNIKYYILNGIYTTEDGYGDFNKNGQLEFKQKYFYIRNSIDTTHNKYKIYTIK